MKINRLSVNKKLLVICGSAIGMFLLIGSLLYYRLTYKSSAQVTSQLKVSVSSDGVTYADSIEIDKGQGYYLKTDPPINGYLEARSPRSDGSYRVFKWSEPLGAILGENGVFHITGEQISSLLPGTYTGEFRPWVEIGDNTAAWSNKATVVIKDTQGTPQSSGSEQATGQLKVMTFNVLHHNEKDATFHREKMAKLAQYMKDNRIEIAGLQEMKMGSNDMTFLKDALEAIGYSMPYIADGQDLSGDFRNVLFSKYPISNYKEVPVSGGRSILDMTIDTPFGKYAVVNMHVIHTKACESFVNEIIPHLQKIEAQSKNIIFMGDMNLTFYNSKCEVGPYKKEYYLSCVNNADGSPSCGHTTLIDYIAIHKKANAQIDESRLDWDVTLSDHKPIIATLRPKSSPITTPSPMPQPHTSNTAIPQDMILIPAGTFQMGCATHDTKCSEHEKPLHTVYLDSYAIDKFEVTNSQYIKCVEEGKCTSPSGPNSSTRQNYFGNPQYGNYPVMKVTWEQSNTFCKWAGKRLPTEAEWEKAARGSADTRIYPWGNTRPNCTQANTGNDAKDKDAYAFCVGDTTPVGKYPNGASPYGVMDMTGNLYEWVSDWYDANYYASSPNRNPQGPSTGTDKVKKGGSWGHVTWIDRISTREFRKPTRIISNGGGFRCAISL